jgi:menaquinone-dependent protoporphyrinogen oxidase
MERILVVHASRMGSTEEIAQAIGTQLTSRGFAVDVRPTTSALDAPSYDAVVVGSAVYNGHWDKHAVHYLQDQAPDLAERPTWLFQSGPCGPNASGAGTTPHHIAQICSEIGARPPRTFGGNLDPARAKTWLARRFTKGNLSGDYRDWDAIRGFADEIADALNSAQVPTAP